MGKKFDRVETTTEVDLDDLQFTIRNDDTNKDWLIYASFQRDPRASMGTARKNMVKDGILTESESDMFWSLLEKIGEGLVGKRDDYRAKL